VTPERGVRLAHHTSLRVGGPADYFALARSAQEIAESLRWARDRALDVHVIGGGTNLLVADAGVSGLVVKTAFSRASITHLDGAPILHADAGANLANLARRMANQNFGGLEWAANVPGTVGGAVVNNAGAFGGDTAGCLIEVTLVDADGSLQRLDAAALQYAYRTSILKQGGLGHVAVESARLRLWACAEGAARARVQAFNTQRMRTQPRILSAGSVFANPEGFFSGKLVDEAALKGSRAGGAQISEQHANFIVNLGHATAQDVYILMRRAQDGVYERTGVWLRPEIELLGRWTDAERAALRGSQSEAPRGSDPLEAGGSGVSR
jgi:UDP-N-acetylmuramate dehydrogenase